MKHDWLSDEERNYLKSLDSGYVAKNKYKEYIDYTPKYEDYFIEKVDKNKDEESQNRYEQLREERFSHNDEWWKERKSTIKTMVEEGIFDSSILHQIEVIDNIYEISKI